MVQMMGVQAPSERPAMRHAPRTRPSPTCLRRERHAVVLAPVEAFDGLVHGLEKLLQVCLYGG